MGSVCFQYFKLIVSSIQNWLGHGENIEKNSSWKNQVLWNYICSINCIIKLYQIFYLNNNRFVAIIGTSEILNILNDIWIIPLFFELIDIIQHLIRKYFCISMSFVLWNKGCLA